MTSIIIVGKDPRQLQEKALLLCNEAQIDTVDITIFNKPTEETKSKAKKPSQSIGIEDIKQLQQKLFLKPVKSQTKALIIPNAETLTIEAQNALLKVLEEPPAHTIIILQSTTKESFLPTIISRCQVIELSQVQKQLTDEEKQIYTEFLTKLPEFTIADSLEYAEKVGKTKEDALLWLEKCILFTRETMLTAVTTNDTKQSLVIIQALQQTHTLIKTTNANLRLTLENLFLSFVTL